MTGNERQQMVAVALALLKAAILNRDILDSAPAALLASCPPDIFGRLASPEYQGAFDRLPADIRENATALVLQDPLIVEARRIDALTRSVSLPETEGGA